MKGTGYTYNDTANSSTTTFMPPELTRIQPITRITETAQYLDASSVRINRQPIWEIATGGGIQGISAIEEDGGNSLEITNVETRNKIIRFRNQVGKGNRIRVEYRTHNVDAVISNNLNPIFDPSAFNYYHIYYIVPTEHLIDSPTRSVFVYRLRRFESSQKLIFNTTDFLQFFELNMPFILTEISDELRNPPGESEAYPIGVFYIETPVDEDYMEIIDSRVRGGGFTQETEQCGEWSYWEGEASDISGRQLIRIKKSIKQALKDRFLAWDNRCHISTTPAATAEELTMEWIHKTITKHIKKGYHYELEFIDG